MMLEGRPGRKPFFFEKKNQKTFMSWTRRVVGANAHGNQSFFASFFAKKEVLLLALTNA